MLLLEIEPEAILFSLFDHLDKDVLVGGLQVPNQVAVVLDIFRSYQL